MTISKRPAIVAPGGSLQKACLALAFGADAVYVGLNHFGLRKSATNLTTLELNYLCNIANANGQSVYVTMNGFPNNDDMANVDAFLEDLSNIPLTALIISDIGLLKRAKALTSFRLHASTQASIMNSKTAEFWVNAGADRLVLAREVSIKQAAKIKQATGTEIELFIHGAMCSSVSGKCTISNVTSGRDSNRGGCVQSCRHSFTIPNNKSAHIMNAKDLMGIDCIPDYIEHGIDAVKIEGRMKSAMYVTNAVHQYNDAINTYCTSPSDFESNKSQWKTALSAVSNRGFSTAFLTQSAGASAMSYDWNGYSQSMQFLGIAGQHHNKKSMITCKHPLSTNDPIYYYAPSTQSSDHMHHHSTPISKQSSDHPHHRSKSISKQSSNHTHHGSAPNSNQLTSHHLTKITPTFTALNGQPLSKLSPSDTAWLSPAIPANSILVTPVPT